MFMRMYLHLRFFPTTTFIHVFSNKLSVSIPTDLVSLCEILTYTYADKEGKELKYIYIS